MARRRRQGHRKSSAEVEQVCVVTLEPFRSQVSDEVERYFLPGASEADASADVDPFSDGVIELGEVVVESLSLALDPYPRKPGATFEAGDATTEERKRAIAFRRTGQPSHGETLMRMEPMKWCTARGEALNVRALAK